MRRTSHKVPPKPETLATIQDSKIWKMENEFYQFVRKQFRFVKSQTFQQVKGQFIEKSNRFHYEKIRPRWGIIFAVNKIFYCIDLTARGQGTSSDKLWMTSPVLRSTGHHFVTWSWCSSFFYLIVLFLIFGKNVYIYSLSADLNI